MLGNFAIAQHYEFEWSSIYKGNSTDAFSCAYGPSGELYNTGAFRDTMVVGNTILSCRDSASYDMYLVKYDAKGNVLWAIQGNTVNPLSGSSGDCVEVDKDGNVFLAMGLYTNVTIDGQYIENDNQYKATLLLKLNPEGKLLWHRKSVGLGSSVIGLCLDNDGNPVVMGNNVGANSYGHITITPDYNYHSVYTKYSSNGDVLWATKIDGNCYQIMGIGITADAQNNIYTTGNICNNSWFGAEAQLTAVEDGSTFMAKISPDGKFKWAKILESTIGGRCLSIASFENNIFITGRFGHNVQKFWGQDIPPSPDGKTNISRGYTAKFNSNADLQWVKFTYHGTFGMLKVAPSGIITLIGGGASPFYAGDSAIYGPGNAIWFQYDQNGEVVFVGRIQSNLGSLFSFDYHQDRMAISGIYGKYIILNGVKHEQENYNGGNYSGFIFQIKDDKLSLAKIHHLPMELSSSAFPNPARASITVKYELTKTSDVFFEMSDLQGRLIKKYQLKAQFSGENIHQLDLNDLQSGMYLLKIKAGENEAVHKIFKN